MTIFQPITETDLIILLFHCCKNTHFIFVMLIVFAKKQLFNKGFPNIRPMDFCLPSECPMDHNGTS